MAMALRAQGVPIQIVYLGHRYGSAVVAGDLDQSERTRRRNDPWQSAHDRGDQAGIPANGKPVPAGAKMAKIHWTPKPNAFFKDATCQEAC